MHPFLQVSARTLHSLALALWLGGLIAIGALVAPTAFHVTRSAPALAGNLPLQNTIAGGIVGGSLRLFNYLTLVCGVVLLVSNFALRPASNRRWTDACLLTTCVLLGSALLLTFGLTPAMDAAQSRGDLAAFDRMHHGYEQLSTLLQFPLLLLLTFFSVFRDTALKPSRPSVRSVPTRTNSGEPE